MKKLFALICVGAFAGSMASAQWLVYDYKASIKNLELKVTTVKYSLEDYDSSDYTVSDELDSYTVVSNSLSGFLVIPMCMSCSPQYGAYTSVAFPNGYAIPENGGSKLYLKRSADKTKKIWKFDADVAAGLFNQGVAVRPDSDSDMSGTPTSLTKLTQAWMWVDFEFDAYPNDIEWDSENEYYIETDGDFQYAQYSPYGLLPYGWLGFGSDYGYTAATGFGKAKAVTEEALCQADSFCFAVDSISGSIIGWDWHIGVCSLPSIWDLCYQFEGPIQQGEYNETNGVITGTWSVKINKKVSEEFLSTLEGDYMIGAASDLYLLKKLKKDGLPGDLLYTHPYHQNLD